MKIKTDYLRNIGAWLLPYACILCNNPSSLQHDICHACLKDLPLLSSPCPQCAKPIPENHRELICGDCLKTSPPFHRTHALFAYRQPITKLIMQLKFNHALANARLFGELLATKIKQEWYQQQTLPQVIIPVPLHKQRLKERGFNQALEIARSLQKALDIPIDKTHCIRHKYTFAQATLHATERQKNVKQAFQITHDFSNQHVTVIDDVITTGFTITEFCKTLKNAGAKTIDVWCIARAYF